MLLEGLPFILAGSLVSGIIDAWLPASLMEKMLPRGRGLAILVSGLLGLIFPVCECAIVPVISRLVKKGLPVGCAMTYMLASPIVNPITALSTWAAFQQRDAGNMVMSRLGVGYIIAVIVGLVLSRVPKEALLRARVLQDVNRAAERRETARAAATAAGASPPGSGILRMMRATQRDFLDVALYFIIGVTIAALLQTQMLYKPELQGGIQQLANNYWLAAPVLMLVAFVLSLCSTTDAFVVAQDSIFPATAKLAFLTFGPMFDMKLILLYSTVLKPKVVFWLGIGVFIACYVASFAMGEAWKIPFNPLNK